MPPSLPPESHYDPKKLQKIFAIITLVLLFSLIGLFAKDYARDWKNYQRQFRAMEVEKARVKLDAEEIDLSKNEEYQNVLKEIETAAAKTASQKAALAAIEKRISNAAAVERLHTQQYQFAKAEYAALKYKYETSRDAGSRQTPGVKSALDKVEHRMNDLRLKVEADQKVFKERTDELTALQKASKDLEKKRLSLAKRKEILERKLSRIDIKDMSAANQLAEMVRDMPIIDLANPNYKINQIVVKDIPEDVNFMKVPRVDRCTTCHLGIDNPDFKDAAQPFKTHPNLELFMDKNSPHPVDQFACTTCHGGRGRATDFISAAHTPHSEEQKKEWQKKYNWKKLDHWEHPILPKQFTESSCFKCHQDQGVVKGAEKLNLGLSLVERAGCYSCHAIDKYKDWPKPGPSLEFLASKTTKEWAYRWIWDPKSMRPDTWMPSYFNQSNNSDPSSIKRSEQEVLAMVSFLFANSKPFKANAAPVNGDAVKGKELVASVGCMACHQTEPLKTGTTSTQKTLLQQFGPTLEGMGSKTTQAWLYDWLKNPQHYHAQSRMPNMRLSDQEASDIAAYLAKEKSPAGKNIPGVNEDVLNTIVMDFLKKSDSISSAKDALNKMDRDSKLKFAGEKLIREYGCFSCHQIKGFENEKPIGVELNEEGDKSIERLDFAFSGLEHTKQAWFNQKLLDPRIFDKGRVLEPLERTKMPNFNFTKDEAEAVTAVLLGLVKDRPNPSKMAAQGVHAQFINEGQKNIRQMNCQACHVIEGEGGSIQDSVTDWLIAFQGKEANDAKTMTSSFSPPSLLGEGKKVQAQWLYGFLHEPTPIRPWLSVRMPTYHFHKGQINTLVKYFNYLDQQEFPFTDMYHPNMSREEFAAAEKLFSKEIFGCTQCHIVGDQMPSGSMDSWAPNLALADKRLKPDWIIEWMTNPALLQPGTKMPTFYDPNDFEHAGPPDILNGDSRRQIKALRDYLLTISADPSKMQAQDKAGSANSTQPTPAQ